MAVVTRDNFTICDNRSDVENQRWDRARLPVETYWDSYRFNTTSIVLCTQDSSVFIADINGYFKEL